MYDVSRFFCSSRRRHTRCALVTGVQTCALPISGVPADRIVFSGVGKTREELTEALQLGIYQFALESEPEAEMLSEVAVSLGKIAPVAFRINPDVDAGPHAKISTGKAENNLRVPHSRALAAYALAPRLPVHQPRGSAGHTRRPHP